MSVEQRLGDTHLRRSGDAWLGGVCASVARKFEFDPLAVRIMTVVLTCLSFGVVGLLYALLWAFLPRETDVGNLLEVQPEYVESSAYGLLSPSASGAEEDGGRSGLPIYVRLAIAICLMLLFLAISLVASPIVDGSHWWQFWPVAWIICGLCLMVVPIRSRHVVAWHAVGIVLTAFAASLLPMTLGVMAFSSYSLAFGKMWFMVAAGVLLFVVGFGRNSGVLMIAGACCLAFFFVSMFMFYGVPGNVEQLVLKFPGREALCIGAAASLV